MRIPFHTRMETASYHSSINALGVRTPELIRQLPSSERQLRIQFNRMNQQLQRQQQSTLEAAPPTDEELFARIREHGDEAAFTTLYKRYDKRLYAYCLRATGSHEATKDAFQAIMSIVFEKRESFTGGSYAAWLFTIARHHVLKLGRNAGRTSSLDDNTAILETTADESTRTDSDFLLKQSLHQAIARLPDDLREAFELKYCQGLQHEEIAETLGITLSLAKVRVFRAKQQLRTSLAAFFEEIQ